MGVVKVNKSCNFLQKKAPSSSAESFACESQTSID
jgi:hypothetical protein